MLIAICKVFCNKKYELWVSDLFIPISQGHLSVKKSLKSYISINLPYKINKQ